MYSAVAFVTKARNKASPHFNKGLIFNLSPKIRLSYPNFCLILAINSAVGYWLIHRGDKSSSSRYKNFMDNIKKINNNKYFIMCTFALLNKQEK